MATTRERDDQKLLTEFKDLIRIPAFRDSLFHKIEEMKYMYADKIKNYKTLPPELKPVEEKREKVSPPKPRRTAFEIRRNKAGWKLFFPGPLPGPHPHKHYFPQELFDYIIALDLLPQVIHMEKCTQIPGRVFELEIEKQSAVYITGSVAEITDDENFAGIAGPQLAADADEKGKTEDLKIFLKYLLNHELLYNVMIGEFKSRWKPLIDHDCILHL